MAALSGAGSRHIKEISHRLEVRISQKGGNFLVRGAPERSQAAERVITHLYERTHGGRYVTEDDVHLALLRSESMEDDSEPDPRGMSDGRMIKTPRLSLKPRGENQQDFVRSLAADTLTIGVGPAGTGKTYLAVASAVEALVNERCRRLVLVRPAIEAGEKLGFLPGDIASKVHPYLRPIYDALYEFLGVDRVVRMMDRDKIEIAPLAFMRGRSLRDCVMLMDEAQNATIDQMKMFLTRLGQHSKAIVVGDPRQCDLPPGRTSGLAHATHLLRDVKEVGVVRFTSSDVVRHPLVSRIIDAYESADNGSQPPPH